MEQPGQREVATLVAAGVGRADLIGLAVAPGGPVVLAVGAGERFDAAAGNSGVTLVLDGRDVAATIAAIDEALRPRWAVWSQATAAELLRRGEVRLATCWDLAAVHRVLWGGWRAEPGRIWARLHGLPTAEVPTGAPVDLFSQAQHDEDRAGGPVRADGHLSPAWSEGGWAESPERTARWAALALAAARLQAEAVDGLTVGSVPDGALTVGAGPDGRPVAPPAARAGASDASPIGHGAGARPQARSGGRPEAGATAAANGGVSDRSPVGPRSGARPKAPAMARAESTAELLCAELAADGLPIDLARAEAIIGGFVGPRTTTEAEAAAERARRDHEVLRHAPDGGRFDLRSPGQVKSLLRFVGIEVPDTRAWRLEPLVDAHPIVRPLLAWRKAERILTTFGYGWLDEHVGPDGRLHGEWSGCDGAAGRMTATAGLHNMPADLRGAVVAEPGHVFVRADLGQIEPRVLAAVSGDAALARAGLEDDMYARVAEQLAVDRTTAKVAVLGAMYGQTTGHGAQALRRLQAAYPVAMAYLESADRAAQVGADLRTYGGRLVRTGSVAGLDVDDRVARSRAAAQGRFGRNAMVQGAAAELFKVWAVTVRARGAALGARIVLCLHDELLVHVPAEHGDAAAALVDDALQEAAARWAPDRAVRFVADTSVIAFWADAKD